MQTGRYIEIHTYRSRHGQPYIYIYIYIHTCIRIYIYIYIYVYVYLHTHTHTWTSDMGSEWLPLSPPTNWQDRHCQYNPHESKWTSEGGEACALHLHMGHKIKGAPGRWEFRMHKEADRRFGINKCAWVCDVFPPREYAYCSPLMNQHTNLGPLLKNEQSGVQRCHRQLRCPPRVRQLRYPPRAGATWLIICVTWRIQSSYHIYLPSAHEWARYGVRYDMTPSYVRHNRFKGETWLVIRLHSPPPHEPSRYGACRCHGQLRHPL